MISKKAKELIEELMSRTRLAADASTTIAEAHDRRCARDVAQKDLQSYIAKLEATIRGLTK